MFKKCYYNMYAFHFSHYIIYNEYENCTCMIWNWSFQLTYSIELCSNLIQMKGGYDGSIDWKYSKTF